MKNVKLFKRIVIFILALAMVSGQVNVNAKITYRVEYKGKKYLYTGKPYKVYYNDELLNDSSRPGMMVNQNVMIPYYQTLVKQGPMISRSYNKITRSLTLIHGPNTVQLYLNKNIYYVNGVKKTLRTAPFHAKYAGTNFIMIPAKAVIPALGLGYYYDKNRAAVYITGNSGVNVVNDIPESSKASSSVKPDTGSVTSYDKLVAAKFKGLSTSEFINLLSPIAKKNYKETGVLASVTLAQAILESGWGKSTLAQRGNNIFGMKAKISGNTWAGSTWDGKSVIKIKTGEEYRGKRVVITAKFRKYPSVYKSIQDHSAYLLNARNGSKRRYAGLTNTTSYVKQITIIKRGGYATSSSYVNSLVNLIKKYKLNKYDVK